MRLCVCVCVRERVDSDREIERETDKRETDREKQRDRNRQRLNFYHISKELNLLRIFTEQSILYTKSKIANGDSNAG